MAGLPTTATAAADGTGSWFREHAERAGVSDAGCWYYASLPANPARGGRFDLPAPSGTCYFADAALVAAMERVGVFTAKRKPVPADIVAGRVVTEVPASALPATAADLLAPAAATGYGVTGELFTMANYSVPQQWALRSSQQGHAALIYTPRFSAFGKALAVFGPSGAAPGVTSARQDLAQVLSLNGVKYEPIPPTSGMTFARVP